MKERDDDRRTRNEKERNPDEKRSKTADDTGPNSVVASSDSSAGSIGWDDMGQPRWTWITELGSGADGAVPEDTFDYLKALDNEKLTLADDSGVQPGEQKPAPEGGYNPYDTARISIKGRFRRR